jgi:D-glycero-D-manno-heptose 1,7-bisphosphate phosphatase
VSRRRAVFLDRDGTLIEERHYPVRTEDIVLLPGTGAALARLGEAGWLRIVLTNQSAVARGLLTEEELGALHDDLLRKLAADGGGIDALYYCPHHPEGSAVGYAFACACRKPGRGLLDLAVAEHDVDLAGSAFIGDSPRDLFPDVAGAGPRILVATGHALPPSATPAATAGAGTPAAPHVAASLGAAADWLLRARGA